MTRIIDYGLRWTNILGKLADRPLVDMHQEEKDNLFQSAARYYLLASYGDQVREELGPLVAPANDLDVLRVRAATIHHWKFGDTKGMGEDALIAALSQELSHFKLPSDAYRAARERLSGYPALQESLDRHSPEAQA